MNALVVRRLGMMLASLGVGLVVLELASDRWFPVGGVIYRLDEALLHDAGPNAARIQPMPAQSVGPGDSERVFVSTGKEGYRGASLEVPKVRPRVLVIGDSLVMAENVPVENTFVRQLGSRLGAALSLDEAALETVNAGRSGYGPDQALLLLERDGPSVAPEVVVFVLCAHNDFGDLMRNKLFRPGLGGELEECRPYVGERIRSWFQDGLTESKRLAIERLWDFYRAPKPTPDSAPQGAIELYLAALQEQYEDHILRKDPEVVSLFEDVYDADVALGVGDSALLKGELLAAIAERAALFCDQRLGGAQLRFVVVPSAVDVCADFDIRVDPVRYPSYEPRRLVEAMVLAARSAGEDRVLDLTQALTEGVRPDSLFVGGTDIHWNAAGQGRCAEAVAAWLAGDERVRQRLIE